MKLLKSALTIASVAASLAGTAPAEPAFLADPQQALERTCFQTGQAWSEKTDLRSDVAIVYGIDPGLPQRIADLARSRLSHPRHDGRFVGELPGLPLRPL